MDQKPQKPRSLEQNARHGMYGTPTYKSWAAMIGRVKGTKSNPEHYALKGIGVCDEWRNFRNFYADMGPRPEGTTLDRKNNALGYCKENCRWASGREQAENRSNTRLITKGEETHCLAEWSRVTGVNAATISCRLRRGWTVAEALRPGDYHCQSGYWRKNKQVRYE